MAYLADMRLVHRDLATRNVLVGSTIHMDVDGTEYVQLYIDQLKTDCDLPSKI